jgi:hypothetical protein
MGKARKGPKGTKPRKVRADEIRGLLNDGVALQIELLDATVRVWRTAFESLAAYTKTATEEFLRVSARGDANAAVDHVIAEARKKLKSLTALPGDIGKDFEQRVRKRARTKT